MSPELRSYLRTRPTVALVGANNRPSKYGNIIFRDLKSKGFDVIPINPKRDEVEGQRAFPNLEEAQMQADIGLIVYVIPPKRTLEALNEALRLGYKRVWIQPGAEDDAVLHFLEENEFEYLAGGPCVMVDSRGMSATD